MHDDEVGAKRLTVAFKVDATGLVDGLFRYI